MDMHKSSKFQNAITARILLMLKIKTTIQLLMVNASIQVASILIQLEIVIAFKFKFNDVKNNCQMSIESLGAEILNK